MSLSSTSRTSFVLALIFGLLGLGFLAKGWRYTVYQPPQTDAAIEGIQSVMMAHGWPPGEVIKYRVGMPMTAVLYHKEDCQRSVTILLLGSNVELQQYVRLLYEGDVVFVRDGRLLGNESELEHQFEWLARLGGHLIAGKAVSAIPILAVTPAPSDDICSPPDAKAWSGLNRHIPNFAH